MDALVGFVVGFVASAIVTFIVLVISSKRDD